MSKDNGFEVVVCVGGRCIDLDLEETACFVPFLLWPKYLRTVMRPLPDEVL